MSWPSVVFALYKLQTIYLPQNWSFNCIKLQFGKNYCNWSRVTGRGLVLGSLAWSWWLWRSVWQMLPRDQGSSLSWQDLLLLTWWVISWSLTFSARCVEFGPFLLPLAPTSHSLVATGFWTWNPHWYGYKAVIETLPGMAVTNVVCGSPALFGALRPILLRCHGTGLPVVGCHLPFTRSLWGIWLCRAVVGLCNQCLHFKQILAPVSDVERPLVG